MKSRKHIIKLLTLLILASLLAACAPGALGFTCADRYDTMVTNINMADNAVVMYEDAADLAKEVIRAIADLSDSDDLETEKMEEFVFQPFKFLEVPENPGQLGCSQDNQDTYDLTAASAFSVAEQYLTKAGQLNFTASQMNELLDDQGLTYFDFQQAVLNATIAYSLTPRP